MPMAGYEEARNPREWPDDAQPIVQPLEAFTADPPAARLPAGVPADDLEDERRVPHWPYVVGALLLLVIPIVVVVILVTVF
jgi:hypothetical protein